MPVVIVNQGATRGDELADLRVDAGCSQTSVALLGTLSAVTAAPPAGRVEWPAASPH